MEIDDNATAAMGGLNLYGTRITNENQAVYCVHLRRRCKRRGIRENMNIFRCTILDSLFVV